LRRLLFSSRSGVVKNQKERQGCMIFLDECFFEEVLIKRQGSQASLSSVVAFSKGREEAIW